MSTTARFGRGAPIVCICWFISAACHAASPNQVALQVDRLLAEELFNDATELAPRADDLTFLRRVWLDLVGDIPTPEEVTAFALDPRADKRERKVNELLERPQYGQNWARYWRDVILYRKVEERAGAVANAVVVDLTEQLNRNAGWDKIAGGFVTALGSEGEVGATGVIMAQDGRTEEIAAEIARIFLGIQIQCAQCHDHPYDSWKREEFHQLAAFFPRVAVRREQSLTGRGFEVVANDGRGRGRRGNPDNENRRGTPEHFMPDLENPTAPGTRMQPRFFLSGESLPPGTPDAQRRGTLAEWIVANEWFAMAAVNRLWSELVGEGFYEPIDDIGPERTAKAPRAAQLLAREFAASGHDLKWLFRTISATEAYQRESRPRRGPGETPFTANVAQRLRADQLYNVMLTSLGIEETVPQNRLARPIQRRGRGGLPRAQFEDVFGYDPSDPRDGVAGSIPQALEMMNRPQINQAILAREDTVLGRLLAEIPNDEALIAELYLRSLSREPSQAEMVTALFYRQESGSRREAYEDLLWALLNSSEFLHRR